LADFTTGCNRTTFSGGFLSEPLELNLKPQMDGDKRRLGIENQRQGKTLVFTRAVIRAKEASGNTKTIN
jgi:hypothetical protein